MLVATAFTVAALLAAVLWLWHVAYGPGMAERGSAAPRHVAPAAAPPAPAAGAPEDGEDISPQERHGLDDILKQKGGGARR